MAEDEIASALALYCNFNEDWSEVAHAESNENAKRVHEVMVTSGDLAFVRYIDGTMGWEPLASVGLGDAQDNDWKASTAEAFEQRIVAVSAPLVNCPRKASGTLCMETIANGTVLFPGLFGRKELMETYMCAQSCLVEGWGTVRRRSVGFPEKGELTPAQSHIRVSAQYLERAPSAWESLSAEQSAQQIGTCLTQFYRRLLQSSAI